VAQSLEAVRSARDAADRHAWRAAYDAYADADAATLSGDDLERFGEAAWWTGRLGQAIGFREQSYAAYAAEGRKLDAARVAITLAWDESGRAAFSVSRGWLATAERLLAGEPETGEHARVELTRAVQAMFAEGDYPKAIEGFERAFELAARFGDRDTQMLALVAKGRSLVKTGEIDEGFRLLDEATAAAVSGELRPYSTTLVYCMTISSCQDLGDVRRAAEWTEAANRWCDRVDLTGFPGACRIHRAEIMRLRGDLEQAEQVAVAACEELQDFERIITASGYYEIGEIRRRRGDLQAAQEAYAKADELGSDPHPGVALLRLAEGKVDAAIAGITRNLGEVRDAFGRLRRLPAHVEIAVAARNLKAARTASDELEQLVDAYKIGGQRAPAFDATTHMARGRISLAEDDLDAAVTCLRRAREGWQEVGAPYEAAQARMLLGIAFRRQGDEHAAAAELEAALATFERLGAKLDEQRAKELLGREMSLRTFVFTDIVGSTRLLETLGDEKWRRLLARHNELLEDAITENGGAVVQHTGDGFFAAFDNPRLAVEGAIAIQRALDQEVFAPDVRIGVHTGRAFSNDGSSNPYGGEAVHLAARVGAAAEACEILVSRDTLEGVGAAFRISEPRSVALKGFAEAVDVVSVDWR